MTGETYRSGKANRPPWRVGPRPDQRNNRGEPKPAGVDASYLCANCDTRLRSALPLPYCSLACKSQATTVRAYRSAFATWGRATLPEDVAQALRIKMVDALAGG